MIEYNTNSEIYKNRAKILNENGWTDLHHPDNWIRKEWLNHPTIDVDRAGVSMEEAWKIANREYQQFYGDNDYGDVDHIDGVDEIENDQTNNVVDDSNEY